MVKYEKECPRCKKLTVLELPKEGVLNWEKGMYVQDAFPELSSSDREILISGFCASCWDEMFLDSDDLGG